MEFEIGPFLFTSNFDSGNLAKAEMIGTKESTKHRQPSKSLIDQASACPEPDFGFKIWTHPDCMGTPFENLNRSWFHFGIRSNTPNCTVQFVLQNLNKHTRLFSHGMAPVFRVDPGNAAYDRIPLHPSYWLEDGQFYMSFIHVLPENTDSITYFAFTYPYTYEQLQTDLDVLDTRLAVECEPEKEPTKNKIYYVRELLCHSLEGRKIELLTVTSFHGMLPQREPDFPSLFPLGAPRPHKFENKRVVFLSARVHPGETPSSFVMKGFLEFILREDDKRAAKLRKMYIIKIIPMLNPDGVVRGHYRTDTRGINLNRVYKDPIFELHPSIFAVKALVLYYHIAYRVASVQSSAHCNSNIYRFRKSFELPRSSSKDDSDAQECKGKNRSFTSLFESKFFNGKSSGSKGSGESKNENLEPTTARRSLSARLHRSNAVEDSLKAKSSVTNHASRRSSLSLMSKPVLSCKYGATQKKSGELLSQQQPKGAASAANGQIVPCKDTLEVPKTRDGAGTSTSSLSADSFFTFSEDWAVFVESVIQIRTELIETLRELRETIGSSRSDTSWSVTTKASSNMSSLVPDTVYSDAVPLQDASHANAEPQLSADRLKLPLTNSHHSATSNDEQAELPSPHPTTGPRVIQGRHLVIPQFVNLIPSECSGIAFYIDMHGHASKRGCFMYGNHFTETCEKVECMLFPKLLSINCSCFDFSACNFSHKNMYSTDKKDGTTKEGSGRVAIHNMTKIIRSYTLECNYNTGNWTHIPSKSNTSATQSVVLNQVYRPEVYEKVGRCVALTMLDMEGVPNTGTKLAVSEFRNVQAVRDWLYQYTKCNELPIGLMGFSSKNAKTNHRKTKVRTATKSNPLPVTTAFAALERKSIAITPAICRVIIRRRRQINKENHAPKKPGRSRGKFTATLLEPVPKSPKRKPVRQKAKAKRKAADGAAAGPSKNLACSGKLSVFSLRKSAAKHYYTLWLLSKARARKLSASTPSLTNHKKRKRLRRKSAKNEVKPRA